MFGLVGWQVKLAEIVVCGFLCFGAYKYVGHEAVEGYKQEVATAQAKADKIQQDKYNKVAQELEDEKKKRQENAVTIHKETERIITNQPIIYSSRCIDDSGLLNANAAITGGATSKPAATVQAIK